MLEHFTGNMARRLLVNWRIRPVDAARALPPSLRPDLVNRYAIAGLCLVRLEHLRPVGLPAFVGLSSENVAIRMGVEFDSPNGPVKSVFIFRRHSPSRFNEVLCHHIGYGVHHRSAMLVADTHQQTAIHMADADHSLHAVVHGAAGIPSSSVFSSAALAESFFRGSECGYSPTRTPGSYDGVRLHLHRWELKPVMVDSAHCTFLQSLFPTAVLDSAFIMRNIEHTWTHCGRMNFGPLPTPACPATLPQAVRAA